MQRARKETHSILIGAITPVRAHLRSLPPRCCFVLIIAVDQRQKDDCHIDDENSCGCLVGESTHRFDSHSFLVSLNLGYLLSLESSSSSHSHVHFGRDYLFFFALSHKVWVSEWVSRFIIHLISFWLIHLIILFFVSFYLCNSLRLLIQNTFHNRREKWNRKWKSSISLRLPTPTTITTTTTINSCLIRCWFNHRQWCWRMTLLVSLLHRRIHRAAAAAATITTAATVAGRQLSTVGIASSRILAAAAVVGLLWLCPHLTSGSLICSTIRPLVAMISLAL